MVKVDLKGDGSSSPDEAYWGRHPLLGKSSKNCFLLTRAQRMMIGAMAQGV